jgi:YVTN family beta-propeller protein
VVSAEIRLEGLRHVGDVFAFCVEIGMVHPTVFSIVDVAKFKEIGFIRSGFGAHGLYPSRDGTKLYVSNRNVSSVSVIDFSTRRVVATWHVGGSPDMGGVSIDGTQLWLSSRYHHSVLVINTSTGKLIHQIHVGRGPHGLAYFPQPGRCSLGRRRVPMTVTSTPRRAGYVYVISNLGAFGPKVVKIGMTRRLEPMDRVRELGDASVPFPFDVHALYFSDDAVTLETELHHAFAPNASTTSTRDEIFLRDADRTGRQESVEHRGRDLAGSACS